MLRLALVSAQIILAAALITALCAAAGLSWLLLLLLLLLLMLLAALEQVHGAFGFGGCPRRGTIGGTLSFIMRITSSASCNSADVGR